jgi:1,2-phenylacetyl-CoA epoxidase catalytic subunit
LIVQHAYSEIAGQLSEGKGITSARALECKAILRAKAQNAAGHGLCLSHATETPGRAP